MKSRGTKTASVGVCAILLASASFALAQEDRRFYGHLRDEGAVSFSYAKGKAPKVRRIEISNITVDCGKDGSGRFNFSVKGSAPVRDDRRFVVRSKDGTGGRAKVNGRFTRDYEAAEGSVRVRGKFKNTTGGGSAECDSGKQQYAAKRAVPVRIRSITGDK